MSANQYVTAIHWLVDVRWLASVFALVSSISIGEDRVTYATRPDGGGRATVMGTIVDYTGRELTVRTSAGVEQAIPASRILSVSTVWPAPKVEGDRLFEQHKYDEALRSYLEALRSESRVWAQRQILAESVSCLKQLGRIEQAGELFLQLVHSDPETVWFGRIPLSWQVVQPPPALEKRAEQWMQNEPSPVAQLMGASWLLATRHRAAAIQVLQRLSTRGEVRLASLATAQAWRARIATVDEAELERWHNLVEKMPREVRAGADYVLAQGLAARGQNERAALAWLRIPLLYPEQDRGLAAMALLNAGRALERIGNKPEAASLYREILRDHAGTPSATQATARLESLGSDG
jgi:tetratricopeptide (TPR) repeat protein